MKTIYLVRHGATETTTGNFYLSKEGIDEVSRLGKLFRKQNWPIPNSIYSSDRPRTIQSAQVFAEELGYSLDLKKMNISPEIEKNSVNLFSEYNHIQNKPMNFFIDNDVQEHSPPSDMDQSWKSVKLDWDEKAERIKIYDNFLEDKSKQNDVMMIFTHANILTYFIDSKFGEYIDLRNYGSGCHTSSFTVLTKDYKHNWKIARLFDVAHKYLA